MEERKIKVVYHELEDGGFLELKGTYTLRIRDVPLIETLQRALPEGLQWEELSSVNIHCYRENFKGSTIDLRKKPSQIPYLMEAHHTPVLYVCKDQRRGSGSSNSSDGSSSSSLLQVPGDQQLRVPSLSRKHSIMASEMLRIPVPIRVRDNKKSLFGQRVDNRGLSDPGERDCLQKLIEVAPRATTLSESQTSAHQPSATLPSHKKHLNDTPKRTLKSRFSRLRLFVKQHSDAKPTFRQKDVTLLRYKCRSLDLDDCFTTTRVQSNSLAEPENSVFSCPISPLPSVFSPPSAFSSPSVSPPPSPVSPKFKRQPVLKRKISTDLDIPLPPVDLKSLQVYTNGCSELQIPCDNYMTVRELKQAINLKLESNQNSGVKTNPSTLVLTYTEGENEYELLDDSQFLGNTFLYQKLSSGDAVGAVTAQQLRRLPIEELRILHSISQLTGVLLERATAYLGVDTRDLAVIPRADQAEVQWTRRTLHDYVMKVAASRDDEEYSLSMELASKEIQFALVEKIPKDNKIPITFHYKNIFSLQKNINVQQYVDSVLQEVFPCVVACRIREVEDRIEDYTLQMTGEQSYIHGRFRLINFKDIRRCILKGEPIHLSVTKRPSPEKDKAYSFSWLTVDPQTTCPLSHSDVSSSCPIFRTGSQSAWENDEQFSFQLQTVENLQTEKTKQSVLVSASLCHGADSLPGSVSLKMPIKSTISSLPGSVSLKMPIKSTISWNKEFVFSIQTKNLPKATKLMLVVNDKSKTQPLHWGLISVFNHRGILRTGQHVIRMWPCKNTNLSPNPTGPAANNPDPEAVTVTICFKETTKPVIFPSTRNQSLSLFFRQHPAVRDCETKRTFQSYLKFIKEKRLYHHISTCIELVTWSNFSVLEVYSLLHELEDVITDIPIETALRLLDCDFPDEAIREFAIRVLETSKRMTDERLEDLLLQLTQALKFEANHDSALARFLLKRALTNKRIGHFFFWYLKCEMYNPQYTARFAVIMEAYLKACGKSMLTKFEEQVKVQATLENIGKQLKEECDGEHVKMQEMLPTLLETVGASKFTAVYNPRLELGKLRPSKCKIISSAKKPLWLEMQNVHPTALQQTPTRLILKLGDDLRQDMITLRMFSLFEKLWEEEGLDLCLIPYGCMATGPKTGFIEVVRNAKTIAEVSGTNDSKKLFEWIRSQQINEYGEVDSDKLAVAVDTFVRSCAGYSVATYVLGIGDRHNDNIMVTTSGNLFHIDFGHFLGNIKYFMGFKREWAPFVLTPDFVYVMGGERSDTFAAYKKLCCQAFLTLRKNADLIINLFSMMRSTGIPELTCVEDTDYIRTVLMLSEQEHEAERHFEQKVIKKCLDLGWTVQVMWWIHLRRKRAS